MIRITTLVWIALLVVAGGTVMRVAYQVRLVERHLAEVTHATEQERQAIQILGAEWDTLNDPKRIDALNKRYLELEPTPIQRVVKLEDIPLKPSLDQMAKALAEAHDKSARSHGKRKGPVVPVRAKSEAPALEARAEATGAPLASGHAAIDLPRQGLVYAKDERRE